MKNRKKIITLGLSINKEGIKNSYFSERISLQDYDILIIDPQITTIISNNRDEPQYNGKRLLTDTEAQKYDENIKHWYREINDFMKLRKTIIILLNKLVEFYIPRYGNTKKKNELINNYYILQFPLELINANGRQMKLVKEKKTFQNYWTAMKEISEYRVYVNSFVDSLFTTQSGDKTIGGKLKFKGGNMIFLPYIDMDIYSGISKKKNSKGNDVDMNFTEIFISKIIELDKNLSPENIFSSAPKWIKNKEYELISEMRIEEELKEIDKKINEFSENRKELKQQLDNEKIIKLLLYEQGNLLEDAVILAFKILGYSAEKYIDDDMEIDAVLEYNEDKYIVEVEGKDKDSINITKLRQLMGNVWKYDEKNGKTEKGILVGNASRFNNPLERKECFTKQCIIDSSRFNVALIDSVSLFRMAKYIKESNDEEYAKRCRETIRIETGIIEFPEIDN